MVPAQASRAQPAPRRTSYRGEAAAAACDPAGQPVTRSGHRGADENGGDGKPPFHTIRRLSIERLLPRAPVGLPDARPWCLRKKRH
jgi:hypothetical protein